MEREEFIAKAEQIESAACTFLANLMPRGA